GATTPASHLSRKWSGMIAPRLPHVLRPELRRTKDRAIPAEVHSGFASGIAQNKRQSNSSKSAQRFCVRNCAEQKTAQIPAKVRSGFVSRIA
ncbi:hypothetical protein ACCT24_23885, partial [Rhizobium ruizarguesonis]